MLRHPFWRQPLAGLARPVGRKLLPATAACRAPRQRYSAETKATLGTTELDCPLDSFVTASATEWHQTVLEHKADLSDHRRESSSNMEEAAKGAPIEANETYVDEYGDMDHEDGESLRARACQSAAALSPLSDIVLSIAKWGECVQQTDRSRWWFR